MKQYDQIYGCLAGLALGDSLGGPTEFLSPQQIRSEYGRVNRFIRAPSWHPHHVLRPGQVTDDTGQALAVARAIHDDGQLTAEDVARELLAWVEQAGNVLPVILGPSTRQALDRLRRGESPRLTGQKGLTNGATYRVTAVGLVNYDQPDKLVEQVVEACLPTHGTTVAISGAAALACAVAKAVSGSASLHDILDAAKTGAAEGRKHGAWAWGTPLDGRIELAVKLATESASPEAALTALYNYVGVDMLVAESVATAFGLVALADGDPMKAIFYGVNIGGDTDTIAALAGAICGAWQGIEAIDPRMLAKVEQVNHLDLAAQAARLEGIIRQRSKADVE
jgi:ADP-ribosylglycohydrolase